MINTKLILVDGITGSGKSTTAHYIARQLEKNGIKAKWYHELDQNHPLNVFKKMKIKTSQDYLQATLDFLPAQISQLSEQIYNDNAVYIIESFLFLRIIEPFISNNSDKKQIFQFFANYFMSISKLNPVVIHLYQEDTDVALQLACARRGGESMKEQYIGAIVSDCNKFCTSRNLTGEAAVIAFLAEEANVARELFNTFDCPKIQLETSAQDWPKYRQQILDLLAIKQIEEILLYDAMLKYCGTYLSKLNLFKIHIADNRLCLDDFWPNLKMIPTGIDRFDLEGFAISFQFLSNENQEIKALKIADATCRYDKDEILTKIILQELNQTEMEKFCGLYWCESDKLNRKIYLKDGCLYYWRAEGNESRLLPVSSNKLAMPGQRTSFFDFSFNGDATQFAFKTKEQKDLIFVQNTVNI